MTHPIETKTWTTWLGAIKAINRAGLQGQYDAYLTDRGIAARLIKEN